MEPIEIDVFRDVEYGDIAVIAPGYQGGFLTWGEALDRARSLALSHRRGGTVADYVEVVIRLHPEPEE